MFSGIIEALAPIANLREERGVIRIDIKKPSEFNDLKVGDSLSTDGVCLTVEALENGLIRCAVGPETLNVTGWNLRNLEGRSVNLERSMKLGDRIHGHFVTGHVDVMGTVLSSERQGEILILKVEFPKEFGKYIWRKGSICVNGVSLTINEATATQFAVCLIPETVKRTNLADLEPKDCVNLEMDAFARAFVHQQTQEGLSL